MEQKYLYFLFKLSNFAIIFLKFKSGRIKFQIKGYNIFSDNFLGSNKKNEPY